MATFKEIRDGTARKKAPPVVQCSTPGCEDPVFEDTAKCYFCGFGDAVEAHPIGHPRIRRREV